MPSLVTERVESIKAGILASAVFGLVDGLIILINHALESKLTIDLSLWQINSLVNLGLHFAIALVSGFLFGLTYRYLIRGDRNSHLQDGAVLAFGLVRGLALIEGTSFTFLWLLFVVESILNFAIARFSLDFALKFKIIKPFI